MTRLVVYSIVLLVLGTIPCQSFEEPSQSCYYDILGFLVHAGADSCPPTGTPTVISKVYGHAGQDNGLLQYDERLYFDDMNYPHGCRECYTQWSPDSDKAKLCRYDSHGNFWYPLSDAQKSVLSDIEANYTFFVCPFTSSPSKMVPPKPGVTIYPSGTITGIIKDWAGPASMPDAVFLYKMNMTGSHVPHWLRQDASWALDGEIGPDDFVSTLKYIYRNGLTR